MYIFISKNKSGSKHFETGDVSASKHFSKCDKRCHLMDRCWVWLSSAVGRKRDHGDESVLPFHTLVRGEVTAWPERCFCHLDSPGTCSFGSESRSVATHPHLGEKKKKLHMFRVFDHLQYQSMAGGGGGNYVFFLEKNLTINIGHNMVLYRQTVSGQHPGVKHLWDLEFSREWQKSSDSWRH